MSLLQRGQEALIRRQQQAAAPAGPVVYRRYSGAELAFEADLTGRVWLGRTAFRRTAGIEVQGPAILWGDRDYMIPADCFEGFTPEKPVRGDRVVELLPDGVERVYEVIAPPDEPEARPSDPGRTLWRVHTKMVG